MPTNRHLRGGMTIQSSKGFTLLEIMLVLFIVLLGFGVIGSRISSGNDSAAHQAAARDMMSALRYARGQALISRKQSTVDINLDENTYTVSDKDKVYTIPEKIAVTVVTAQEELSGDGEAAIRFFPDGSSTGGRIKLERDGTNWQIDINWLTGQVDVEQK